MTGVRSPVAIAAASLTALALAGCGSSPGEHRSSHHYVNKTDRYSVLVPAGWHVSPKPLVPNLIVPKEILSLGTFKMLPGGCDHGPVRAVQSMGPTDALISIQEDSRSDPVTFPPRPKHFAFKREMAECLGFPPGGTATRIEFSDAGRNFYAMVAVGRSASPRQALAVLDSFTPNRSSMSASGDDAAARSHRPPDREPSTPAKFVPGEAAQLFLAGRICKGVLDIDHRQTTFPATGHPLRWRKLFRTAASDLEATGNALGKFPSPDVRSLASGHLKVAYAARALLQNPKNGRRFYLASVGELRDVTETLDLPQCAFR